MPFDLTEYTKFFIAMIAIVDPLAILPLYGQLTNKLNEAEKTRLARRVALAVFFALVIALFFGQTILTFFGISLGSFRVAGGLLLMIMALQLMYLPVSQQLSDSEINSSPGRCARASSGTRGHSRSRYRRCRSLK